MEKKQTAEKDEGSSKGIGKTVNLQGTARMKVNVTAFGRQLADADDHRERQHGLPTAQQSRNSIRRFQPLPDDVRQDSLKSEYKAWYNLTGPQAIAAIRHTANNLATCFANIWHWNG